MTNRTELDKLEIMALGISVEYPIHTEEALKLLYDANLLNVDARYVEFVIFCLVSFGYTPSDMGFRAGKLLNKLATLRSLDEWNAQYKKMKEVE